MSFVFITYPKCRHDLVNAKFFSILRALGAFCISFVQTFPKCGSHETRTEKSIYQKLEVNLENLMLWSKQNSWQQQCTILFLVKGRIHCEFFFRSIPWNTNLTLISQCILNISGKEIFSYTFTKGATSQVIDFIALIA